MSRVLWWLLYAAAAVFGGWVARRLLGGRAFDRGFRKGLDARPDPRPVFTHKPDAGWTPVRLEPVPPTGWWWVYRDRVGDVPGGLERRHVDCGSEVLSIDGGLICAGCGRQW